MAVDILQRFGFLQGALCLHRTAQNAVDQARGKTLFFTILLRQIHGLIHRRIVRHLIQFVNLVQAQMEDIVNHRMQIPDLAGEQLFQIPVQLVPVLEDTVAKPCRQRRVPAVQPVTEDVLLQHAVGPGAIFPAGDQRIQRSLSGAHISFPGGGPGNNREPPSACRPRPGGKSLPPRPRRRRSSDPFWSGPEFHRAFRSLPRSSWHGL